MKITHFIIRTNPQPGELATWVNTMNEVAEGTRLGIPVILTSNPRNHASSNLVYGFQESSGIFSTWPNALGLAAAQDVDAVKEFAEIAREEWEATNIRKMYGYLADTATDPRWYRISETFGEQTELNAKFTTALVEGFQGKAGLNSNSVALTFKHFPGGGARENGTDPHYAYGQWNVYPTPGSLEKYHLPPFEAAVNAGTSGMMPYYAAPSNIKSAPQLGMTFEEVGMAYNSAIINGLLRKDLCFKGYVNSDSGILDAMAWGVEDLNIEQRAAKAVLAGTDIISDTNNVAAIKGAVEKGYLKEKNVDQSAERVLTEMFELGLFENPYRNAENANEVVANPENWEKAYKAHQKSVVLLKNENNILPLTNNKLKNGKLYVEVSGDKVTDIEQAKLIASIKKGDPEIQITNNIEEASYAMLFLRPNDTSNKQNYMLYDLKIHNFTKVDMDKVNAIQKKVPTIISVNLNMPWLLDNLEPGSAALLAGFNTFTEATMDVVRGRFSPIGKLPFTIPANEAVIAVDPVTHENISDYATDVPGYDKGEGYRYKDEAGNGYVSGFGLTYGKDK
jgi:beta-glucosidase